MDPTIDVAASIDVDELRAVTSFVDAAAMLKSPHTSNGRGLRTTLLQRTLPCIDGEEHAARRRAESPLFAGSSIASYEREILAPILDQLASEEIDGRRDADGVAHVDLVDFSLLALVRIGAKITGLDGVASAAVARRVLEYVDCFSAGAGTDFSTLPPAENAKLVKATEDAQAVFAEEFLAPSAQRRLARIELVRSGGLAAEDLPKDVLTILLSHDRADWDMDLALREVSMYLSASIRTSVRVLCHLVDELERWLEQTGNEREVLLDDDLLRGALNETLRLHVVLPFIVRVADTELPLPSGMVVQPGEMVKVLIAEANRDAEVFGADAQDFDPFRSARMPAGRGMGLAFGGGHHSCIGRRVANGGGTGIPDEPPTIGTVMSLTRRLYAMGMEPDPGAEVRRTPNTLYDEFDVYSVRFPARGADSVPAATSRIGG